jgi:hypothetical protein
MSINKAIAAIDNFQGESLTESLSNIEGTIVGLSLDDLQNFCGIRGIDKAFLASALSIKKVAGQINVIIHAAGILHSLLGILESGEVVESVSLGAGNTGRKFDLVTNRRVAEFKFIDWQGGSETIRQNGVFKDFFDLAEYETAKGKYLYVVGTDFPLKFFRGGRALTSVLSRHPAILDRIAAKYGARIARVCDYYLLKKDEVQICDISPYIGREGGD